MAARSRASAVVLFTGSVQAALVQALALVSGMEERGHLLIASILSTAVALAMVAFLPESSQRSRLIAGVWLAVTPSAVLAIELAFGNALASSWRPVLVTVATAIPAHWIQNLRLLGAKRSSAVASVRMRRAASGLAMQLVLAWSLGAVALDPALTEFGNPTAFAGWFAALGVMSLSLLAVEMLLFRSTFELERATAIFSRLDGETTETGPLKSLEATDPDPIIADLELFRRRLLEDSRAFKQALEQSTAEDAAKAEFLGAVSHVLRTPLNAIAGFAQLLIEAPLTKPQLEDVGLIYAGSLQLLDLIDDILDVAMIESGELRLAFDATDIAEPVEEVVRLHKPLAGRKGVALAIDVQPEIPTVVCDRRRVRQILTNVVSNAVKFTDAGAITLTIRYHAVERMVSIACRDTGIGIAPGDLETIFEEYRQAATVKRNKHGTGLGLSIARTIARHHGGSLTAESTQGVGSVFTLCLPVNPPSRPLTIDVTQVAASAMLRNHTRPGLSPGAEGTG